MSTTQIFQPVAPQKRTPWGYSQSHDVIAPGIISHSTASHGGYQLSEERWRDLQAIYKGFWASPYSPRKWLEEDCDCLAAVFTWPDEFGGRACWHAQTAAPRDVFRAILLLPAGYWDSDRGQQLTHQAAEWYAEHKDCWIRGASYSSATRREITVRRVRDGERRAYLVDRYVGYELLTDEQLAEWERIEY